jgi:hypothetical protein
VRFLVEECGAEVDVRDANAYTALHHAASRGDNEVIVYLVDRGADVTVLSSKGQTMADGPVQRVQPYRKQWRCWRRWARRTITSACRVETRGGGRCRRVLGTWSTGSVPL